eukprot:Phypoly_transcript_15987.p1 GENE.Phypoly_transcript_15987~~Phypoly_transcript_15987.p1  ORF type:complete len:224 (+),score=24.61 Phypoly_transcript_15987:203-874(+)
MGFFEEQRAKGPAGELAARLEILLIIIMVVGAGSFIGLQYQWTAVVFGIAALVVPFIGFYGALKQQDGLLLVFVVFTILKVVAGVLFGVLAVLVLILAASDANNNPDNLIIVHIDTTGLVIFIILLILYAINCCLSVVSIVWAQRLRRLIKEAQFGEKMPLAYNAVRPYPAQPYPAQPYPAQGYPAQPYPAQPYPAQPYPAQPYPYPTQYPPPSRTYETSLLV